MADRIITVTDPSVVTNDTLAGYNNYSDIDGQLGTTMTPTEATNGKIVTLSDGSVHEVTSKPVGTTTGEFSAVVSNAVQVDLSSAYAIIPMDVSNAEISETSPGNYLGTAAATNGLAFSTVNYSGDFRIRQTLELSTNFYIWLGLNDVNGEDDQADWDNWVYIDLNDEVKVNGISTDPDTPTTVPHNSGDYMELIRVSNNLTLEFNGVQINDFGTYSTENLYVKIKIKNPNTINALEIDN